MVKNKNIIRNNIKTREGREKTKIMIKYPVIIYEIIPLG